LRASAVGTATASFATGFSGATAFLAAGLFTADFSVFTDALLVNLLALVLGFLAGASAFTVTDAAEDFDATVSL
jgi:hypothetical protein